MSDLQASLDIEPLGAGRFAVPRPPEGRGVVSGSHLVAQMCVAGGRVSAAQRVDGLGAWRSIKCTHALLAKTVHSDQPYELTVEPLRVGRVFDSLSVSVSQSGGECARGLVLTTAVEPDLFAHQAMPPEVGRPGDSPMISDNYGREVRLVGGIDRTNADLTAPPRLSVWIRFPDQPADTIMRQALVTYCTGGFLIGTAMLPHAGMGENMAHRSVSTGILAHTISFHNDVDLSPWLLVTQESTFAGRGRAYGIGQVFTEDGIMLASFSQESLLRPFPEGHNPEGRESTIL